MLVYLVLEQVYRERTLDLCKNSEGQHNCTRSRLTFVYTHASLDINPSTRTIASLEETTSTPTYIVWQTINNARTRANSHSVTFHFNTHPSKNHKVQSILCIFYFGVAQWWASQRFSNRKNGNDKNDDDDVNNSNHARQQQSYRKGRKVIS